MKFWTVSLVGSLAALCVTALGYGLTLLPNPIAASDTSKEEDASLETPSSLSGRIEEKIRGQERIWQRPIPPLLPMSPAQKEARLNCSLALIEKYEDGTEEVLCEATTILHMGEPLQVKFRGRLPLAFQAKIAPIGFADKETLDNPRLHVGYYFSGPRGLRRAGESHPVEINAEGRWETDGMSVGFSGQPFKKDPETGEILIDPTTGLPEVDIDAPPIIINPYWPQWQIRVTAEVVKESFAEPSEGGSARE